jgi:hypothetical protein
MMIVGMLDLFNYLVDSFYNYVSSFGYKHCRHMKAMNNSDIENIRHIHISLKLHSANTKKKWSFMGRLVDLENVI